MTIAKNKTRLKAIDALRGIACLMVFFFHNSIRFNTADTHTIFHYGYLGVQLFFMISGFVIYMTLERSSNWMDFTAHRLTRLYPAYWLCVLITFLVMRYSPFNVIKEPSFVLYFNLTMLQHWIGIKDLDLAYWTLNLELSFYAFMLVAFISGLIKYHKVIVLVLIAPIWLKALFPEFIENILFHYISFFRSAHLFAAGITFYHVYKHNGKLKLPELLLLLICLTSELPANKTFNSVAFIHILFFFFIFFLLARNKLNWIATPLLLFYGQISYVLYLIHENVGLEILKYFVSIGIINWYASRAILLLFLTAICYLISFFYEQPVQKWLNTVWKSMKFLFSKKVSIFLAKRSLAER